MLINSVRLDPGASPELRLLTQARRYAGDSVPLPGARQRASGPGAINGGFFSTGSGGCPWVLSKKQDRWLSGNPILNRGAVRLATQGATPVRPGLMRVGGMAD